MICDTIRDLRLVIQMFLCLYLKGNHMNQSRKARIDVELHDSCNAGYKPLFSKGFSFRTWQLWLCKIQKIQKMTARVGKPCCTQLIAYSSGTNANHWIAVVASCPLQWSSHFLWPKLWKSCCISNLQPVLTVPSSWLCLLLVGQRSTMNLQP